MLYPGKIKFLILKADVKDRAADTTRSTFVLLLVRVNFAQKDYFLKDLEERLWHVQFNIMSKMKAANL